MSVSGTFTAVGVSAGQFVGPDTRLDAVISGTFVAVVYLEFSDNGGLSYARLREITAAKGEAFTQQGLYRFRCFSYTSGTVTYSLTPASVIPASSGVTQGSLDTQLATLIARLDGIDAVLS